MSTGSNYAAAIREKPDEIVAVEDYEAYIGELCTYAKKIADASAGSNNLEVEVPLNELWEVVSVEMRDVDSAGSAHELSVTPKVSDGRVDNITILSGGSAWVHHGPSFRLAAATGVAAGTWTQYDARKRLTLGPGDKLQFNFTSVTLNDQLELRILYRRRVFG